MRLFLLLMIAGGFYIHSEMNDPSSEIGQSAHQIWNEIQAADATRGPDGGGNWNLDYASTAAGRPNTMDWAARGGSSVGSAPDPIPMFGRTDDLAFAKKAASEAYDHYMYYLENYGENNSRAREARQEYLNAKYHYDAIAARSARSGR